MPTKYLIVFYFVLLQIGVAHAQTQNHWIINGQVKDQNGAALELALVYLVGDSSHQYLDFANTDAKGNFRLSSKNTLNEINIEVRFLGYEQYRKKLDFQDNINLKITLNAQENLLREVVVSDKHPPIVERSDTTVFNLADFRDSTEYSIEDVLKKLPGVEVGADGAIKAKGKSISTILIEGSDMFGSRYTLGSKNIRADFIDKVEMIDHFQSNPVLKDVQNSEAIVLNLLMKEDKKNIISGTFDVGLGYGEEFKGKAHLNLFSISKKTKAILLSDNGNIGTNFNVHEIDATFTNVETNDFKNSLTETPIFSIVPKIKNPGLPNPFVDNSKSSFSTLRTTHNFNPEWSMNVNATYATQTDQQQTNTVQSYLLNEAFYRLSTREDFSLSKRLAEVEGTLNYFDQSQKTSLQNYWKLGRNRASSDLSFSQIDSGLVLNYFNQNENKKQDLFFSSLLSQKFNTKSVGQLQLKVERLTQPEVLSIENEDFASFFMKEGLSNILQNLDFEQNSVELKAKYLHNFGSTAIEISPKLFYAKTFFKLLSQPQVLVDNEDTASSTKYALDLSIQKKISRSLSFRGFLNTENFRSQFGQEKEKTNQLLYSTGLMLRAITSSASKLALAYQFNQHTPSNEDLLGLSYLTDNYTFLSASPRSRPEEGHQIYLTFNHQNNLKLRSFSFRVNYNFGQFIWSERLFFDRSIQTVQPVFTKGNQSVRISGRFKQFIPKFKTDLEIVPTWSRTQQQTVIQELPLSFVNTTSSLLVNIRTILLKRVTLGIGSQIRQTHSFSKDEATNRTTFLSAENNLELLFRTNDWNFSTKAFHFFSSNQGAQNANLIGTQIKISKSFMLQNKRATFSLTGQNLLNTKQYEYVQNDHLFFNSNAIEAIPFFFLLSFDYSF